MGMFTYASIKISSKIPPLFYLFVDICFQDWSRLFADIAFTRDTFHSNLRKFADIAFTRDTFRSNLRKTDVFLEWNKKSQRPL